MFRFGKWLDSARQCQIAPGMVGFTVVGLPDKAVAESRVTEDQRPRDVSSRLKLPGTEKGPDLLPIGG